MKLSDLPPEYQEQVKAQLKTSTSKAPKTNALGMNKTEAAFARTLVARHDCGEIAGWRFESIKLRLATKTWYTPDFAVYQEGGLDFYEVKGFMRDDAAVKLKVAAEQYPQHRFYLVRRVKREWQITLIPARRA